MQEERDKLALFMLEQGAHHEKEVIEKYMAEIHWEPSFVFALFSPGRCKWSEKWLGRSLSS